MKLLPISTLKKWYWSQLLQMETKKFKCNHLFIDRTQQSTTTTSPAPSVTEAGDPVEWVTVTGLIWRGCYLEWRDTKLITSLINTRLAFSSYWIRLWALNDETEQILWPGFHPMEINFGLNGNEISTDLILFDFFFSFFSTSTQAPLSISTALENCDVSKCRLCSVSSSDGRNSGNVIWKRTSKPHDLF